MMEEFHVAEEAREANVRLNQLSQDEVSHFLFVFPFTKSLLVRLHQWDEVSHSLKLFPNLSISFPRIR